MKLRGDGWPCGYLQSESFSLNSFKKYRLEWLSKLIPDYSYVSSILKMWESFD